MREYPLDPYHLEVIGTDYEELTSHERAELVDYLTSQGIMPEIFRSTKLSPNDPGWRGRVARYIRDLPSDSKWFKVDSYELRLREVVKNFTEKEMAQFVTLATSSLSVRIDPMVTTDIHRIFRMPETLNNKTGLVKRECVDLSSFDPSIEAVALNEAKDEVEIMIDMCPKIELGGRVYGPYVSISERLPRYVAVYIAAKGAGRFLAQNQEIETEHQPTG